MRSLSCCRLRRVCRGGGVFRVRGGLWSCYLLRLIFRRVMWVVNQSIDLCISNPAERVFIDPKKRLGKSKHPNSCYCVSQCIGIYSFICRFDKDHKPCLMASKLKFNFFKSFDIYFPIQLFQSFFLLFFHNFTFF